MVKGSKHSKEAKDKISKANMGYKLSNKVKENMRNAQKRPIRFIKNDNGCYICISHARAGSGKRYPVMAYYGKTIRISRYLWELKHGEIPDGMFVCHTCDNTSCINIKHFFLGTPKDNQQDCIKKGRTNHPVGEGTNSNKLSAQQVKEIRDYKHFYGINKYLAKKYKVSTSLICMIKNNRIWKHLL